MRTHDVKHISEAVRSFTDSDFNHNEQNIYLENEQGDLAIFEYDSPGVVIGHYCFQSRGRKAVNAALSFLDEIFNPCYNIHVIKGFTALTHLGARWLNRRIGFKSYGLVQAHGKTGELFILTKKEYQNK